MIKVNLKKTACVGILTLMLSACQFYGLHYNNISKLYVGMPISDVQQITPKFKPRGPVDVDINNKTYQFYQYDAIHNGQLSTEYLLATVDQKVVYFGMPYEFNRQSDANLREAARVAYTKLAALNKH